jgi:hypothetical protein
MNRKMSQSGVMGLLENPGIRRSRVGEVWYYSVLDVIGIVAETDHAGEYLADLRRAEPALGNYTEWREAPVGGGGDRVEAVEMTTAEGVLRLCQSIRSPRAERVRLWLAESGRQRLEEADNPELAMLRARREYERHGRDRRWVDKRLRAMSARHELTSEWARRGATESDDYRALTNRLMESAFGMAVEAYRREKHLAGTSANLRDHMSDTELMLTHLAEAAAVKVHRERGSVGVGELMEDVADAGKVAAATRKALERAAKRRRAVGGKQAA